MKHRATPAKTKRRFWPFIAGFLVIALTAGGMAAMVSSSGHGTALGAAAVTPAVQQAQVLAALKHRAKAAPQRATRHNNKHKHKHKRKHGHGHGSPSPHPTSPSAHPTTPGTGPVPPTSAPTSLSTSPTSPSTGPAPPTSPSSGPTAPTSHPTTPTSAPTTPSPSPTRSSPSAPPASAGNFAWCSTDAFGTFDTSDGFDLYNNEWNSGANPGPQKICGNNGHDWQVTSTQRAGNTAVLTYPSVQKNLPSTALSSFSSMTSSWSETMNATSGTDAEAAYDIWINDLNKEVMFWVDNHGQNPAGNKVGTVSFGGLTWNLWVDDGYYAFVLDHNATSGSVDLLAGLQYLISKGYLASSDKLWQVNFGFEICSTGGAAETFDVSNFAFASS